MAAMAGGVRPSSEVGTMHSAFVSSFTCETLSVGKSRSSAIAATLRPALSNYMALVYSLNLNRV